MKRFLINSIKFLVLLVIGYFSIDYYTRSVIKEKNISVEVPNTKYIVLGHSHPECVFNDTLIDDLTNLPSSTESYFYTFNKIKSLLKHNNKIDVLFLEYSNNQITKLMNSWIWGG